MYIYTEKDVFSCFCHGAYPLSALANALHVGHVLCEQCALLPLLLFLLVSPRRLVRSQWNKDVIKRHGSPYVNYYGHAQYELQTI